MFKYLRKYFLNRPDKVLSSNHRFWSINNAAGHFALVSHILFLLLFGMIGTTEMFLFNFLSIGTFVFMIFLNNRGHHLFSALLGIAEVCLHQVLAVKYLGWDSGFQYYIITVSVFPFMQARGKLSLKFIFSLLILFSFFVIEILYRKSVPEYSINEYVLYVINFSNISFAFIFIASWGALFNFFAFKVEGELDQRGRELIQQNKLASMGKKAAELSHEVNTPLGAIKASAGESLTIAQDNWKHTITAARKFKDSSIEILIDFIKENNNSKNLQSTREERVTRKKMQKELEMLGIKEPQFTAQQLVKVGIFHISDNLKYLLENENKGLIIAFVHNILSHHRNLETVIEATNKASRLVATFKEYAHTDQNENSSTDVQTSIEEILAMYQNLFNKGIELSKNIKINAVVDINGDKLSQIWTNLIHNAIHSMNNKGVLTIDARNEPGFCIVTFSDTGHGIPLDIQQKIFEPFFTTKKKEEGTGLGLDIIKNIIEKSGGEITLKSEVGKGTSFYIKLPLKIDINA